jgi:hypothetical protein
MYEAGDNLNTTGTISERVAAQRAFFNFGFFSAASKNAEFDVQVTGLPTILTPSVPVNISFTVPGTVNLANYTIQWASSIGGTFSPAANLQNVTYTPPASQGVSIISVTLTNACNRLVFGSQGTYVCPSNFTVANAGFDRQVCLKDSIHLNGNTPVSGKGTWSQLSGPNTAAFSNINLPAPVLTNIVAGAYQFVWTIGNDTCYGKPEIFFPPLD